MFVAEQNIKTKSYTHLCFPSVIFTFLIITFFPSFFPLFTTTISLFLSGFGGLEVSVLAFGTRDRGFNPGRSSRIFRTKNSSARLPSEAAPCRKFTACKRTEMWRGSRHFRQNSRPFLVHSSTFRCWVRSRRFRRGGHLVAGVGTF